MKVSEVMTRSAECVKPDATLEEAAAKMKSLDVGSLPICDNDRLTGMITDRDITVRATAEGEGPKQVHVRDVMTPGIVWCYEDDDVQQASQKMKEHQIRRLPVLNHDKRLVGMVSLGDLAVQTSDEGMAGDTLQAVSEGARPTRQSTSERLPETKA